MRRPEAVSRSSKLVVRGGRDAQAVASVHALAGVSLCSAVITRRSACRSLTFMAMSALIHRRISSAAVRNRRSAGRTATALLVSSYP